MPLDFKETGPDLKKEKDKKDSAEKARLEAIIARKGKGPAPLHLDSQVIPTLVRKVGDWKTGRISQPMCEAYLDRHTLVFDRELLTKMFTEADYKKEGSLDTRALTIAISGRFPKREHTDDWRNLAAMLMGLSELVLMEDIETAVLRKKAERPASGTFNSSNFWDIPPPPLPPVRRRTASARPAEGTVSASELSPEWMDTMTRTAAAAAIANANSSITGLPDNERARMTGTMRSGSAGGVLDATGSLAGGGVTLPTRISGVVSITAGLKQVVPVAEEQRLNAGMTGDGTPRSTFSALRDFKDFSCGLEITSRMTSDGVGLGPGSAADEPRTATRLGSPKSTVRVFAAPLPPSAISLPPSALRALRDSVRSTTSSKPDFVRAFKPLDSHELDLKRTLGQDTDMTKSLARVEPVRDTKVLPNADYVAWCDYAANCRTSPAGWYFKHPVAFVQDTGEHKYPWC